MRLNNGIRRRLAPLAGYDLHKLKLLYSLIFSLPGSPVLYYGDDIGMGDDMSLADRGGLRTPMQWNGGQNAGFSAADPRRLYAPIIRDPAASYQRINVEAQLRDQHSLLLWLKKLIAIRKILPAFAHGTLEMISSSHRQVLTYLRQYDGEAVVVIGNLSGQEQRVALDLRQYTGAAPIDVLSEYSLSPIDTQPYICTLDPYGFCWLRIPSLTGT
jgi:maltose alpha-D-glucosyltransferase/alpha-amylase